MSEKKVKKTTTTKKATATKQAPKKTATAKASTAKVAKPKVTKEVAKKEVNITSGVKSRLKLKYINDVVPALIKKFNYTSVMECPKIEKVVLNCCAKGVTSNTKLIDDVLRDMSLITGQRPVKTKAKKSIAQFKLREGLEIGCKVTLRGEKMYYFLDKLFNIALGRSRDFRGCPINSFDGRGNYTLGIPEQIIFPEVDTDVNIRRGLDVVIVTTAKSDDEGAELLRELGLPFERNEGED